MIEDYSPTGSVKGSLISLPERVFLRAIPGYQFGSVFVAATGREVISSGFKFVTATGRKVLRVRFVQDQEKEVHKL